MALQARVALDAVLEALLLGRAAGRGDVREHVLAKEAVAQEARVVAPVGHARREAHQPRLAPRVPARHELGREARSCFGGALLHRRHDCTHDAPTPAASVSRGGGGARAHAESGQSARTCEEAAVGGSVKVYHALRALLLRPLARGLMLKRPLELLLVLTVLPQLPRPVRFLVPQVHLHCLPARQHLLCCEHRACDVLPRRRVPVALQEENVGVRRQFQPRVG
eukprot:579200-Rhodomonas_salina.1